MHEFLIVTPTGEYLFCLPERSRGVINLHSDRGDR